MKLNEINLRDPFILREGGKYYLYGTRGVSFRGRGRGFDVFTSNSAEGDWDGPFAAFDASGCDFGEYECWAPEVHKYRGVYFMFATFRQPTGYRGTYILRAERPEGPFVPHSDGAITPREWHSLDGTFYVSPDGEPYMVFCHEWVQIGKGTIEAVKLSPDLRHPDGEPRTLIESKNASWVKPDDKQAVTDGPFLYRDGSGGLLMLWSSFSGGYITSVWRSSDGTLDGAWSELPGFLFSRDGGHSMIYRDPAGNPVLALHSPNKNGDERPVLLPIREDEARGLVVI